jgi:DNA-binding PadR family transcriptional regulator
MSIPQAIARTKMFSLNFDRATLKISEKIWNLTIGLVKKVLNNTGLDEGDWYLRVPHRIRKKGCEKFKAIRVDYGGTRGIRIRCKPQGNETSFEYTLVPPPSVDIDTLFNLLTRVHPKTLEIHETMLLKKMIEYPEMRELMGMSRNVILPLPPREIQVQNTQQEPLASCEKSIACQDAVCYEKESEVTADVAEEIFVTKKEFAEITEPTIEKIEQESTEINKIQSLALSESTLLSDQEALDRALLALSFVVDKGYVKKALASTSIIENLEIKNFIKNISNGTYVSVEGAMRSLTMALRKNNYIERVLHGVGESVRGYKITHKGEKRIVALKKLFGNKVISKMNDSWSRFENADVMEPECSSNDQVEQQIQEPEIKENSENYERLESLVASLKEANEQIVEANGFIDNLNSEKSDLSIELMGLNKAVEEQIKMINKFKEMQEEIKNKIKQKDTEIGEWKVYQTPYEEEKNKLRREIEKLAGAVGIGFGS